MKLKAPFKRVHGRNASAVSDEAGHVLFLFTDAFKQTANAVIRTLSNGRFQDLVNPWMTACFGEDIPFDRLERGDRLLEEVFELLQSGNYPRERVAALRDYVWDRPKGDPEQELGGVMITLAAYSTAFGLDMHEAGEIELERVLTKVEQIREKQKAKPTGSALPIAMEEPKS